MMEFTMTPSIKPSMDWLRSSQQILHSSLFPLCLCSSYSGKDSSFHLHGFDAYGVALSRGLSKRVNLGLRWWEVTGVEPS